MEPKKLEVEGGELLIKSSKGIMAVIPKDRANWAKGMIEAGRFDVIDKFVSELEVLSDKENGK